MGENKNDTSSMSLSKQRKLDRKKEIAQMKRNKRISKIVSICVLVAIIAGIGSLVGYKVYRHFTKVTPSSDYGIGLSDNGFIKDVTASNYVTLPKYDNIVIPNDEVAYTDEDLSADIKKLVSEKASMSTETDAEIADGDKVNIDYVGSIDGVEFAGGNSNGQGSDLTIGSGSMIDTFEEQLIGHKVGDIVDVVATFPEPYSNSPDLAGKTADFKVTINGIYIAPDFDDAFVAENYSSVASTAEEYKEHLRTTNRETNITQWLEKYIVDNSTISSYPSDYIKALKQLKKGYDMMMYQSYNNFYQQNYGYTEFNSFADYINMSEAKYDKGLTAKVEPMAKENLVYQAVLELSNVTITDEDFMKANDLTQEEFDNETATYSKAALLQEFVHTKALEILTANSTVE